MSNNHVASGLFPPTDALSSDNHIEDAEDNYTVHQASATQLNKIYPDSLTASPERNNKDL